MENSVDLVIFSDELGMENPFKFGTILAYLHFFVVPSNKLLL